MKNWWVLFKRFSKETAIYGSGQVIVQLIGLILFPLFTNPKYFTPAEFGQWNILYVSITILTIIFSAGLTTGFFKYYTHTSQEEERHEIISASILGVSLVAVCCFILGLFLIPKGISALDLDLNWHYYILIMGIATLGAYLGIANSIFRADSMPGQFVRIQVLRFATLLTLSFIFIVFLGAKLWGILGAFFLSALITLIYALIKVLPKYSYRFNRDLPAKLFRFSLPLMPTQLAGWVLSVSDRLVIGYLLGNAAVGQYSAGYTIGMIMNGLVIGPFSLAWGPFMFREGIKPEGGKIIGDLLLKFTGVAGVLALGISLFSQEALSLITSEPSYSEAWKITPWVAFGYIFYAYYLFHTTGFNIQSKTGRFPLITLAVSLFSIGMNMYLLPRYGIMAAAVITLVSYFLLFLIMKLVSQSSYKITVDAPKLGMIWSILIAALLIGYYTSITDFSSYFRVMLKVSIFAAAALGLFKLLDLKGDIRGVFSK